VVPIHARMHGQPFAERRHVAVRVRFALPHQEKDNQIDRRDDDHHRKAE